MRQVVTVAELLKLIATDYANSRALNSFVHNEWQTHSTHQYLDEIKYLALALAELGFKKDDKIGLMSLPSSRWSIVDLAIMACGGVTVPLFANISEENFLHILGETELNAVFVGGDESWRRCEDNRSYFNLIVGLDDAGAIEGSRSYEKMLELGQQIDAKEPELYAELLGRIRREDLATIIYTSGSTGLPKGVEHTHYSLTSILHTDPLNWSTKTDTYLNVLPLAHVYARVMNLVMLAWGIPVYYFNDLKSLSAACREIQPRVMVVVPRLLEKVYSRMVSRIQQAPGIKRVIGQWAIDLAHQEQPSFWTQLMRPIADKLVYSHLREGLGGHLRIVLSGGASLDPHLHHFLRNIGIPVFEGWGLTESCPVAVNRPRAFKIGAVGQSLDPLEVKVSAQNELLVRGSNVMRGYFHKTRATAEVIDAEGWLHTGDKGSIDADGFITIVGRLKELVKTSTGEWIAPIPIEQALCKASFIDLAMVVAEHRKFVSALLQPDWDVVQALKAKLKQSQLSDQEFLAGPYISGEMTKLINGINEHLNHWEQIHAYRFFPQSLTVTTGELTPSMKIVRPAIEKKYKDLIDSMYTEEHV